MNDIGSPVQESFFCVPHFGNAVYYHIERKYLRIKMNTEIKTENTEIKTQFILDEKGKTQEIPKDKCKPVEYPIKYKLKNAFEVFVRIKDTENYWISNYGRCVNNHHAENTFYKHKEGKCHYTIYEIRYVPIRDKRWRLTGEMERDKNKRDTTPELLVAETFLVQYKGRNKVWHKDGDESNNWYKNLLTVSAKDYKDLKTGKVTWQELNLEQEYIEYQNKASSQAYHVYNSIKARCRNTKETKSIHKCYNDAEICQEWKANPRSFVKWYLEHYYEVEGESMSVDKDLFGNGSRLYSPESCCILPQGLNTLLTNCKKRYKDGDTPDDILPLGVRYSKKSGKYFSMIAFTGTDKQVLLSEWNTKEEAFAEYKTMKQADILVVAAKYKGSIPDYIYKKLLEVDVKPY